jgi:predicted Rossmann-fold nucleotide-binding protein
MLTTLTVTKNTPVTIIYQDNKYSKKTTDPLSAELISTGYIPPEDCRKTETCSG